MYYRYELIIYIYIYIYIYALLFSILLSIFQSLLNEVLKEEKSPIVILVFNWIKSCQVVNKPASCENTKSRDNKSPSEPV